MTERKYWKAESGVGVEVPLEFTDTSTCTQGSGCSVQGAGFRVQGAGCRVQGAGCRVQGSGSREQGSGLTCTEPTIPGGVSTVSESAVADSTCEWRVCE